MRVMALLLIVVFSGCLGSEEPSVAGADGGNGAAGAGGDADDGVADGVRFEPPSWAVGDWWTYRFDDGAERTWVVTEAGAGYVVDIDDPEFAFVDAALSDISTVGPITADLAGAQDGQDVDFFQWPLMADRAWSLIWDGIPFEATAAVSEGGAAIEAVGADGSLRQYTYDNTSGWFGHIVSVDANGSLEWRVDLTDFGSDYSGTYARYAIHETSFLNLGGSVRHSAGVIAVPAEATDIWYDVTLACDPAQPAGQVAYSLVPPGPNQEGLFQHHRCPAEPHLASGTIVAVEGTWRDALSSSGVAGHIWVVPRTLTVATL